MKSQIIRKMLIILTVGISLAGCFSSSTAPSSGSADNGSVGTDNESVGTDNESVGTDNESVGTDNESVGTDNESVGTDNESVDIDSEPDSDNQGVEASNPGVKGKIQKGPFQVGAGVAIQELSDALVPNGTSYLVYTTDDFGSFALAAEIESDVVEIITQGYYFNEVSGKVSDALLTLRALSKPGDTVNVNILTTLIESRIRALVADGSVFDDAREQAQSELLEVLRLIGVNDDIGDFTHMDLSGNSDADAVLIAASAVFQGDQSVSELSALISNAALDSADGVVDDEVIIETLLTHSRDLDLVAVRSNLEGYFDGVTIPTFEDYVDGDGDGSINRNDSTCSYSPENAAYNQDAMVLDADDGDVSLSYDGAVFLTADYTGTVTSADVVVLVMEPAADTVIESLSRSTLFVAGGTLDVNSVSNSEVYVRNGASVTIGSWDYGTLYVEDGASVTIGSQWYGTLYVEDGASVTIDSQSHGTLYVEDGGSVTIGSQWYGTFYVEDGGSVTIGSQSYGTLYVEDGASVTIGSQWYGTFYVEDGGSATIGVMQYSQVYAYSGASVTETGLICISDATDPYDPSDTAAVCGSMGYGYNSTVTYESGASVSVATVTKTVLSTTMGDFPANNEVFPTNTFETSALNLDVTAFTCVNGYETTTESTSTGGSYFIEHGGAFTLTDATDATVAVQNGGTLTISGGSGHVVYAQLDSTITLSGSASDVTVYYESEELELYYGPDYGYEAATVTLSSDMTGTGNVVEAVGVVLLY